MAVNHRVAGSSPARGALIFLIKGGLVAVDLNKLIRLAELRRQRFPEEEDIFRKMTRLFEECGELAQAVNHFEDVGVKAQKYGPASRDKVASELRDVFNTAVDILNHYQLGEEFRQTIDEQTAKFAAKLGLTV